MALREIALELGLEPEDLEKESMEIYLAQKIRHIEAEIFRIGSKHGVKNVFEMDKMVQTGKIHEKNSWEDFFELDNLETERVKLKKALENLR